MNQRNAHLEFELQLFDHIVLLHLFNFPLRLVDRELALQFGFGAASLIH